MRFIHTADWHLGNSLFNIDRTQETEQFLIWLSNTLKNTKADALVVSGDIFDTTNPSMEARHMYNRFLASLVGTTCKNVIIVGGNHDSAVLLDSQREILDYLNVHVVGTITGREIEDLIVPIKDKDNRTIGLCGAVPYAREIELRRFYQEKTDGDLSTKAYSVIYETLYKTMKKKVPLIATGHLYAANLEGRFENLDKEERREDGRRPIDDVVGNLGSVDPSVFKGFDYVALGHIHYTTMVDKNPKVRYSGSPFVLGFDEADLPRHVLLVDIEEETKVEKIRVPHFYRFKRLEGDLNTIKALIKDLKINNLPNEKVFLEIVYKRDRDINIQSLLEDEISKLPENITVVNKKPMGDISLRDRRGDLDEDEVRNLSPEEIFKTLILSKSGIVTKGKTEEEIKEEEEETVAKYLPLFMDVYGELEGMDENS